MSEGKKIHNDELTETKKPGDVQLAEEELSKAAGGAVDTYLILEGIKGESADKQK